MAAERVKYFVEGTPEGGAADEADTKSAAFWWKAPKETVHEAVFETAKSLADQQRTRSEENLRHLMMYAGSNVQGFGVGNYTRSNSPTEKLAINGIESVINTKVAKLGKNRPRPSYMTSGGNWELRRKAKKLEKFTQGQFHESRVYELGPDCLRDGGIFGTGVAHVCELNGRVHVERVICEEILVDDAEALYGDPRQMFRRKVVAREVLLELYPDCADIIGRADEAEDDGNSELVGDMVQVVMAWHLPSGPVEWKKVKDKKTKKSKRVPRTDGRYVMCLSSGTLCDEPWTRDYFPFAFLRSSRRPLGFWGKGTAERLFGKQVQLNRLLKTIYDILRHSVPRVFLEHGSKVIKSHLTNEIGAIVGFSGTPPIFNNANMVPPELIMEARQLLRDMFEEEGVSQLSASSKKPEGLNQPMALREYNDIETERFVIEGQGYEQFFLDLARLQIDTAREIARREDEKTGKRKGYRVRIPGRKFLESIDWEEIDLDEDQYVMQAFPVSSLPSTPAARRQEIAEWIAQGWIDELEGRRLMNLPDLEQSTSLAVAALDDADATVDAILEDGRDDIVVEEYQNPALLLSRALAGYLRAKNEGCPEQRLDLLRDFIADCKQELKRQKRQDMTAQASDQQFLQRVQPPQQLPAGAPASPAAAPLPPPAVPPTIQ